AQALSHPGGWLRRGSCRRRLRGKHCTPGSVEVVEMLIVAQQHSIKRTNLFNPQSRPRELLVPNRRCLIIAGRIERGVGQQSQPVELDERGRAANKGERNL